MNPLPHGLSVCPVNTKKLPLTNKKLEKLEKHATFHNPGGKAMLECLCRPPGGSQSHPKSNAEESCELFPHGFSVCPLNTKNSKSTQLFTILLGRAMLECLRRATEGPQSHPKLPQGASSHTKPAPSHPNGAPSHPKGIPSHPAGHPEDIDYGKNQGAGGVPALPTQ